MDGSKIRELRRDKGWSQQELARRSGIAQSHIAALETGKSSNLTIENLKSLALAFEIAAPDLLVLIDPKPVTSAA